MLKTQSVYTAILLTAVADARIGSVEGKSVTNLRGVIETGLINQQIDTTQGPKWVMVPTQDYFDVAVWDADLQAAAGSIVKGQKFSVTPRSFKGGKPYTSAGGDERFVVKIAAAELVPGALPKAARQAVAAGAAPAFESADDEVPF